MPIYQTTKHFIMSWPASTIIDVVFIPIYVVLAFMSLFNVIFHGAGKTFGFIYLLIFSVIRLVANILLVYSYNTHYKNANVLEWGYILQGLGYSFLISATLAFLSRASKDDDVNSLWSTHNANVQNELGKKKMTLSRVLYLANLIALILLITGYTDSNNIFPTSTNGVSSSGNGELNAKAKIGDLVFLALTVVIGLLSLLKIRSTPANTEPRIVLSFMLIALVPMLVRIVYVTIESFTKHPFQRNLAGKVILEYITEVVAVTTYGLMGLLLRRFLTGQPDIEINEVSQKDIDASHNHHQTSV